MRRDGLPRSSGEAVAGAAAAPLATMRGAGREEAVTRRRRSTGRGYFAAASASLTSASMRARASSSVDSPTIAWVMRVTVAFMMARLFL